MKYNDLVGVLTRKLRPPRKDTAIKAVGVTAGIASAIWVAMKLKRELYGPGGTKLSRHDRSIDKVWPHDET